MFKPFSGQERRLQLPRACQPNRSCQESLRRHDQGDSHRRCARCHLNTMNGCNPNKYTTFHTDMKFCSLNELQNKTLTLLPLQALDRGVGTILQAVEESGRADNTMIIFTSDNGGPGTNYMPEINAPFRGWKATLFEGGVRVPFCLSWPKR